MYILNVVFSYLRHGRQHTIMPSNVNYQANIWALREEGCTHLLVTTACGSLREEIQPGDIVIIDQFIDRWVWHTTSAGHGSSLCFCFAVMFSKDLNTLNRICVLAKRKRNRKRKENNRMGFSWDSNSSFIILLPQNVFVFISIVSFYC